MNLDNVQSPVSAANQVSSSARFLHLPPTTIHPLVVDFEGEGEDHFRSLESQFHSLDYESTYADLMREEMERLRPYFDAFAVLWGVDLRAITSTRMLTARGYFSCTPVFCDTSIFQASTNGEKSPHTPFFERGKRTLGDLVFSATYLPKIHDMRMGFSVLKVPHTDEFGTFEANYPLFSFDPRVLKLIKIYHETHYPGTDLSVNPLLVGASNVASRRVHDWFHGSILYNTQSASSALQRWSDDSFFVEHIFTHKGMINYEYLANSVHFQIWQKLLASKAELKTQLLSEFRNFLSQVAAFGEWLNHHDIQQAEKIMQYLAFFAWRSIFDIIPFTEASLVHLPYYQESIDLLAEKEKLFLTGIYNFQDSVPFDSKSSDKYTLRQIIDRYVGALLDEEKTGRLRSQLDRYTYDIPDERKGDVALNQEFEYLPDVVKKQIPFEKLVNFDPWCFRLLRQKIMDLKLLYPEYWVVLLQSRIQVDAQAGVFYLEIADTEIDFDHSKEVTLEKRAIFFHLPSDFGEEYQWDLSRALTLSQSASGGSYSLKPGDWVCVNVQNPLLIDQLMDAQMLDDFDQRKFLDKLRSIGADSASEALDIFPYEREMIVANFQVEDTTLENTNIPLLLQSKAKKRQALQCPYPVTLRRSNGAAYSILGGALIAEGESVHPVLGRNFEENYASTRLSSLPPLAFKSNLYSEVGANIDRSEFSKLTLSLLEQLQIINTVKIHSLLPVKR